MSALLPLGSVLGGLVMLVAGGDVLVRGAASLAKRLNVSEIAIGLTVVALGTSAPEFVISAVAAARGEGDIVFGNVIGSNLANTLLILGVAGLVRPLTVQRSTVWREVPFSLFATILVLLLVRDSWEHAAHLDVLTRMDGLALLGLFGLFLIYAFGVSEVEDDSDYHVAGYSVAVSLAMSAGGVVLLGIGGRLTVSGATWIAESLGLSQQLIACTILAIGTSLPELVTSSIAAWRGRCDLAIGNCVGSSVFNLLFVLGGSAVLRPVVYSPGFDVDLYILTAATGLLFVTMFTGKRHRLERWEASLMLVGYAGYIGYLIAYR